MSRGITFFLFQGGGPQHPLEPENPPKSINCTSPGGGGWASFTALNTFLNDKMYFDFKFIFYGDHHNCMKERKGKKHIHTQILNYALFNFSDSFYKQSRISYYSFSSQFLSNFRLYFVNNPLFMRLFQVFTLSYYSFLVVF